MISVEDIEPEQTADAPVEEKADAPEEPASSSAPGIPRAEPDIEDVPEVPTPERAAPKKRGRPKAAPKEKPMPKPKGRPRKVTVVEEEEPEVVEPPHVTDDDLRDSLGPILRLYASHLMRGRAGKRAQYRSLFSR